MLNPHKMNKVDISMSEQDQKAFKLYGKMPAKNALSKMQKDRKYFDSGDYMMSKAGVSPPQPLGTAIPTPEGLPHASPPQNGHLSSSPTGQPIPFPSFGEAPTGGLARRPSVGVGLPQPMNLNSNEGISVPGGANHQRRGSESHRISPPGSLRENAPPSSYPIQHNHFGSSPVKTSALANRVDEEMEA